MAKGSFAFLAVLQTLSACVSAGAGPDVFMQALWPASGSIAGGTYLIIKGVGWTLNGQPGVVTAYIDGRPCVRNQGIKLDSSDINFSCWTPPLLTRGMTLADDNLERTVLVTANVTLVDGTTYAVDGGEKCFLWAADSGAPTSPCPPRPPSSTPLSPQGP